LAAFVIVGFPNREYARSDFDGTRALLGFVVTVARGCGERYCVAFGSAGVGVCAGALSLVVRPGDVIAGGWVLAVRVRPGRAELNIIVAATNTIAAMPSGTPQPASASRRSASCCHGRSWRSPQGSA
jgi:hypothetical protein